MTVVPSIRKRLSGTLFVVSNAWALAVSFVVWVSVRHEVDDLMDDTLQESAEILYGLLSFNASQLPPDVPPHLQRTRDAADRLQRVVTALLTMFRAGADVTRSRIDLHELAGLLPFPALMITASGAPAIVADAELLTAALMNLLDNSLRHGATQGELCALVDASGIDEPRRLDLQDTLDRQAYDGRTGLGLMLADLVARAHGGRLAFMPVASGCALEMRLASS